MLGNLRGIRESGRIFAVPTYFFVATMLALIAVGRVAGAATGRGRAGASPPIRCASHRHSR